MTIPSQRIRLYIGISGAYFLLTLLSDLFAYPGSFFTSMVNELWRVAYVTILNFILFEFTLPYLRFTWKRIVLGLVMIWILLMFYSFGMYSWRTLGVFLHIYSPLSSDDNAEHGVEFQVAYSFASIFFFGIVRHIYDHVKLKQSAQQLRIEKQEAELNYLKSQTNPHFLFNTLNNIYSLARDKSDLAPESILRLSKMLRFMLYETSGTFIALEDELRIITDYIALEKLRYDESLRVNFNYHVEDMKQAIPPLILIPLVENAFKHGVSETRQHPFVDIHLSSQHRQIVFIVKNSTEHNQVIQVKENIGLSNLRRQLELLYTDYSLVVEPGESAFTITLRINLGSHV